MKGLICNKLTVIGIAGDSKPQLASFVAGHNHEKSDFLSIFLSFVSSDRSSYSDDGLLYYIYPQRLFQIFTQSIDAIDVTSVTLSCLNSINAIDVARC